MLKFQFVKNGRVVDLVEMTRRVKRAFGEDVNSKNASADLDSIIIIGVVASQRMKPLQISFRESVELQIERVVGEKVARESLTPDQNIADVAKEHRDERALFAANARKFLYQQYAFHCEYRDDKPLI